MTRIIFFISFLSFNYLTAQTNQLIIEENASTGPNRTLMILDNKASGSLASTGLRIQSGFGTTLATGTIDISNTSYTGVPGIAGFLNFTSGSSTTGGNGINFRCVKPYGEFRYYIGSYQPSDLKMVLSSSGNLGIGSSNPNSKLEIADGDIYIKEINRGIIMTSPNGQCWRLTLDNSGNFTKTMIACP